MIEVQTTALTAFLLGGIGEGLIGLILYVFLAVVASRKAMRYSTGVAVPVWLIVIWLMPYLGAILALLAIRKTEIPTT